MRFVLFWPWCNLKKEQTQGNKKEEGKKRSVFESLRVVGRKIAGREIRGMGTELPEPNKYRVGARPKEQGWEGSAGCGGRRRFVRIQLSCVPQPLFYFI